MTKPIAVFKDVSYQYPQANRFALLNVNLAVKEGEFLGVIGPTGAGKTSLCLGFNGIVPQFYRGRFFGSVKVAGLDTVENPISRLAGLVGMVFEDPETQLIGTSVENEIAFALENLKVPRQVIRARVAESLSAARLEGYEKKHPHELSGGEKQRLAIAAALAVKPSLIVLDEPTSQLDPVGVAEVFTTVQELNREQGVTIVMTGHSAEEMAEFADRIALISRGEIALLGTPDEIYADIETLEANDLRPPQVASTFYSLAQIGFSVPKVPVRMRDADPLLKDLHQLKSGDHFPIENPPDGNPPDEHPPGKKGKTILSVKDLTHVYPDGTEALRGVSLDITENEYVVIMGQNGAGKTTLVKHFLNLLRPAEGSVKINGVEAGEVSVSDLARSVGYVAQNPDNQIFNNTVGAEIGFALENLGYDPDQVEVRLLESLAAMDLANVRHRHPLSLPKGDRARVVIAAVLAMDPAVVIFDEPTTGQDYRGARQILDITRDLYRSGKTVIVITHHLYLMPEYADRAVVMGKGTILLDEDIRTAFYAADILEKTYLTPPQAVLLSQELRKLDGSFPPLLTPREIVDYYKTPSSSEK